MSGSCRSLAARIVLGIGCVCLVSAQDPAAESVRSIQAAQRRLLVGFRQGTPPSQADAIVQNAQGRTVNKILQIGVHVVELPANANPSAFTNAVRNRPEVEFVETDELVPVSDVTPNDPWYAGYSSHLRRISAPSAWSITTGSSSVIIAIVDTGVDGAHADLASRMVPGWNFYDNNSVTSDVYGHGTKVAGTAAAATNNAVGVAAPCWNCWIMPMRISDSAGYANYSTAASAITWAADHGARVANLSYSMSDSSTVQSAARYLWNKGGVITISSGNSGIFDSNPDNPYILTVGATDNNDVLYAWSNTGNNLDLVAPGCVDATTLKGGGYSSGCGTSFSAPLAAGVAALVMSAHPGMTAADVIRTLQQSADDLGAAGWDSTYGWGRLNAARAVGASASALDTQAPAVAFLSPLNGATISGTQTVQVSATDNVAVASVRLSVDGVLVGTLAAAPYTWLLNTTTLANGAHTLSATALDAAGNSTTVSIGVTVSNVVDTQPPSISITSPAAGSTVKGNVAVAVNASDNVGVVNVELYVDGRLTASSSTAPFTLRWNTQPAAKGAHTLTARAYDRAGNSALSAAVTVYK